MDGARETVTMDSRRRRFSLRRASMFFRPPTLRLVSAASLLLGWILPAPETVADSARREISVDAIAHPDLFVIDFFSYRISKRSWPDDDRPWQAEAIRHIRTALSGLGLFEAPIGVAPDLTIEVDSGVLAPRTERRTRTVPVMNLTPLDDPTNVSSITMKKEVYLVSVRLKYLTVTARPRGATATLWRVHAAVDDGTAELGPCLPLLAAAVMNHVGHDTHGVRTVRLLPRDADADFIRRGMP